MNKNEKGKKEKKEKCQNTALSPFYDVFDYVMK
jgi:hypothetical protein